MILLAGFHQILTQIKGFFRCCGYLNHSQRHEGQDEVIKVNN